MGATGYASHPVGAHSNVLFKNIISSKIKNKSIPELHKVKLVVQKHSLLGHTRLLRPNTIRKMFKPEIVAQDAGKKF